MSVPRLLTRDIEKVSRDGQSEANADQLALEEPLEIQAGVGAGAERDWQTVAITMRTPGHDRELALGFLAGEGMLRGPEQIETVFSCGPRHGEGGWQHRVRVALRPDAPLDLDRLRRNFYTTSSCGICGKTSLEALELTGAAPLPAPDWQVDPALVVSLPGRLREAQEIFDQTGGLHAAGLFTREGCVLIVREDVGRHNAVDKVVGAQLLAGVHATPGDILVVSGRASFELVQKAVAARIPMLVAVGAPSSLAVEAAEKFGLTLAGFTKPGGFNLYAGAARVRLAATTLVNA